MLLLERRGGAGCPLVGPQPGRRGERSPAAISRARPPEGAPTAARRGQAARGGLRRPAGATAAAVGGLGRRRGASSGRTAVLGQFPWLTHGPTSPSDPGELREEPRAGEGDLGPGVRRSPRLRPVCEEPALGKWAGAAKHRSLLSSYRNSDWSGLWWEGASGVTFW